MCIIPNIISFLQARRGLLCVLSNLAKRMNILTRLSFLDNMQRGTLKDNIERVGESSISKSGEIKVDLRVGVEMWERVGWGYGQGWSGVEGAKITKAASTNNYKHFQYISYLHNV